MTTFVQNTGGTLPSQWFQFSPNGPLQDLDANPTITITELGGPTVVGPTSVGVVHAALGTYTYLWNGIAPAGQYLVVWNGLSGGNPFQADEIVTLLAPSAAGTIGPCNWEINTGCCTDFWSTLTDALKLQAANYATMVLWSATGRQFGACEMTVRPCGRWCENQSGWWWDNGTWMPYIFNGLWYNCACGIGPGCQRCEPRCQVYLPGPVHEVTQVLVDGAVVDPATYRVDDQVWLVRTGVDGTGQHNCWPYRQDFSEATTDAHTFQVTYSKGNAPPAALLTAAGTLACEYAKACMGQECRLPGRITSVARQGVSVNMVDVDTLIKSGLTGIIEVDNIIRALNPGLLHGRTRMYSPDLPVTRMQTWP